MHMPAPLTAILRKSTRFHTSSVTIGRQRRAFGTIIGQVPLDSGGYVSHLQFTSDRTLFILDPPSIANLTQALQTASSETELRALFLRSTIAGADIKYMKGIESPEAAEEFIRSIDKLCSTIQEFPTPVISIIDGPCLGAGMEVAASCDIRIAVRGEKTIFGMPETKVGIPSVVQASLLPGLIGWGRAKEVLYFGNSFGADTAVEWGFANEVVSEKSLGKRIRRWEHKVNETGPKAVRAQKELMRVCFSIQEIRCWTLLTTLRNGRNWALDGLALRLASEFLGVPLPRMNRKH
jgi:enoyl-CoA hydratase